jgi:hypothetical protein
MKQHNHNYSFSDWGFFWSDVPTKGDGIYT